MNTRKYERELAVKYAKKWALSRNPKYYNFDPIGGDCTSFVSQCLFAGSQKMNFNFENGWYYNNGYDKSPSWSGVEFLYKFLTTNKSYGPRGKEISASQIESGDIIQLSFSGNNFEHSLFVLSPIDFSVAAHTYDVLDKKISEYTYSKIRYIHIENVGY